MILRACTVCAKLSDQSRCPEHRIAAWAGSDRRDRTVSGWAQQKRARAVMSKYGTVCHVCGRPCATEVDHVIPLSEGGADTFENLRPIHGGPNSCHARKTAEEAARGRARRNPTNGRTEP